MSEKEIPKRAGMSAEKEHKLDAKFAARILRKRAKRMGSKQKAKLAAQVGTSVDNVQYYWECYKRKHFKKVRWAILPSNVMVCEQNFSAGIECSASRGSQTKHFLESLEKQGTSLFEQDKEEREGSIWSQVRQYLLLWLAGG